MMDDIHIECMYCGNKFFFSARAAMGGQKPRCFTCGDEKQLRQLKKEAHKGDVYGYRFDPPFADEVRLEEPPRDEEVEQWSSTGDHFD